jgi:curli biogenesis system outer membrane secretion channel CsgG
LGTELLINNIGFYNKQIKEKTMKHTMFFMLLITWFLSACGASTPTIQYPELPPLNIPKYIGPKFRVVVAPLKKIDGTDELLQALNLQNLEKLITEQATNALVSTNYVSVLERTNLDGVVNNLNLEADATLFNQKTTKKKGNFLGAELILVGALEKIEPNISSKDLEMNLPYLTKLKASSQHASIQIGLRLVDAETSKILASVTGHGIVKTFGLGIGVNFSSVVTSLDTKSQTPISYATRMALVEAIVKLTQELAHTPWSCPISEVKDSKIFLNCGSDLNLKKEMVFQLISRNGEIKDDQGQVIGFDESPNGEVSLTAVQPKMSIGTYQKNTVPPKKGDVAIFNQ